jgi:hypothetical protein
VGLARTLLSPLPGDDHRGEGVHGLLILPLCDRHYLGFGELQNDGTSRNGSARVLRTHDQHNVEVDIDGAGRNAPGVANAAVEATQQHSTTRNDPQ